MIKHRMVVTVEYKIIAKRDIWVTEEELENDDWEEQSDAFAKRIAKTVEPQILEIKKRCPHNIEWECNVITDDGCYYPNPYHKNPLDDEWEDDGDEDF